jgi:hypothetical protein
MRAACLPTSLIRRVLERPLAAAFAAVLVLVAACATASVFPRAEPGFTEILSEDQDQIPAGKVMDRSFTVHADAKVRLDYQVEAGKELDIYFVNDDQYARAAAGEEPTELGRDFISVHRGVVGQGNVYELLPAGRHHIVFRNLGDGPVGVRTRAVGTAHDLSGS